MQLSFRHKEQLFHELAQLSRSGVPSLTALDVMARASGRLGHAARDVREAWKETASASQAFLKAGFGRRDAAILEAGEQSGRLEDVYTELSAYYAQLYTAKKTVTKGVAYPIFLLHFGVLVLAAPSAVQGGVAAFFGYIVPILLGFYLLVAGVAAAGFFIRRSFSASAVAARIWLAMPLLGGFLNVWSAWNFSLVLALYVRAGGGLLKAFDIAGKACGNAALGEACAKAVARVQTGEGLAEAFRQQRDVPLPIMRAIEIGEQAGRLDSEAIRASDQLKAQFMHNLDVVAEWVPRLLYITIVLLMAWQVMNMVSSIGDMYDSALEGVSE